MEPSPALIFFLSMLASIAGTLPFGPINLSVVDTTINRSWRAAFHFSIAAALIEIPQSFIAIRFNPTVQQLLQHNVWVKSFVVVFFVGIGLVFFLRKPINEGEKKAKSKNNDFINGLLVSIANPQAIPFWIFILAFLKSAEYLDISDHPPLYFLCLFLSGVACGKLLTLLFYAFLSQLIVRRAAFISQWMNKIIGVILMGIGLVQGMRQMLAMY
jgi:threonine/homoserine/homoserine lactone efflux protein